MRLVCEECARIEAVRLQQLPHLFQRLPLNAHGKLPFTEVTFASRKHIPQGSCTTYMYCPITPMLFHLLPLTGPLRRHPPLSPPSRTTVGSYHYSNVLSAITRRKISAWQLTRLPEQRCMACR